MMTTTGQRIAAKRKELNLSQEALGERLGVSRQSIYKWESDTSLPDIDKLVAMSRMFSVPVGWLLGVEEDKPEQAAAEEGLSDGQLRLVEEILSRYQAEPSPPPPKPPRWKRWGPYLLFLVLLLALNGRISRLNRDYQNQFNSQSNSVNNTLATVSGQISSLTGQVEDILKAQNALTADYGTELRSGDLRANTVTFSLRAVPKTYQPGMTAEFVADSGDKTVSIPGTWDENQAVSAQLTCALTDHITLSVIFRTGETSQTQLLDTYTDLYAQTLPLVDLADTGSLMGLQVSRDGTHLTIPACTLNALNTTVPAENAALGTADVTEIQVGLFRNRKPILWLQTVSSDDGPSFQLREETISVSPGDELAYAAVVTDSAGRRFVCPVIPFYTVEDDGAVTWATGDSDYSAWADPADWGL